MQYYKVIKIVTRNVINNNQHPELQTTILVVKSGLSYDNAINLHAALTAANPRSYYLISNS